jgi:hypothetical protein
MVSDDLYVKKIRVVTLTACENDNWSKLGLIKYFLELKHKNLKFLQTERIFADGVKSRRLFISLKGVKKPKTPKRIA